MRAASPEIMLRRSIPGPQLGASRPAARVAELDSDEMHLLVSHYGGSVLGRLVEPPRQHLITPHGDFATTTRFDEPYAHVTEEPYERPDATVDDTPLPATLTDVPYDRREPIRQPPALKPGRHARQEATLHAPPPEEEELAQATEKDPPFKKKSQERKVRRLGRSLYHAIQTHGHFGLVDAGEPPSGNVSKVIVHVPKRSRGYVLDIRVGDVIDANSTRREGGKGRLNVVYVTRYKYEPPGHAVTSCVIGVPSYQWDPFIATSPHKTI